MPNSKEIAPRRRALRALTYGLYIISVKYKESYSAAIVTWLSQFSFDPAQIMLALRKDGRLFPLIQRSKSFAVNIPTSEQKKYVSTFFKGCRVEGNAINGWSFHEGKAGAPLFEGAAFYLECEMKQIIDGPDHYLVIAEVSDGIVGDSDKTPLTLANTGWKYGG